MTPFKAFLPDSHKIYAACLGIMCCLGLVSNLSFAATIFVRGLESKFTTCIIKSQVLIDSVVCFLTLMLVIFPNSLNSTNDTLDVIVCRVWTSQGLFWWVVSTSIYNLVFTAIDRYWAVLTPQKYKHNQKRKLIIAFSVIFGMTFTFTLPSFLQSKFENGSCTAELQYDGQNIKLFFKVYAVFWFIFIYGFPTSVLIYIYGKILTQLKKSVQGESGANMKSAMKSFTKGTMVATVIFMITISYDALYYMLGNLDLVEYVFNSPVQVVGVFLTSVNSSVNPIVFFILVKTFRQTFFFLWCKCCVKFINRKVSVAPGEKMSSV